MPTQTPRPPRATRRRVVTGAAWTTPVVLLAAPAPAFAASACDGLAFPASGTSGNGWATTVFTGMSATVGGAANFAAGPQYQLQRDPATANTAAEIQISTSSTFRVGTTYTISFSYSNLFVNNPRQLIVDLLIDGAVQVGSTIDSNISPAGSGSRTVVYTPGTAGTHTLAFRFRFPAQANTAGDDINLFSPTVTCV